MRENITFYNPVKSGNICISSFLLILFTLGGCKSIDVKDKSDLLPYMKMYLFISMF